MNKYEIVKKIEEFAPLDKQEKWDSSGWIVDKNSINVNKVLFALTITDKIYEQALKNNCDMIISHHPLFSVPIKYKNIDMYCAHTNFDKADGGTTDLLIQALGYIAKPYNDFVRIVELKEETDVYDVKSRLMTISPKLRMINNNDTKKIRTIGFCAGSGAEFINETPCDAFVTGDVKFHAAIEANKVVFDIGHFESERVAVSYLRTITGISEKEGLIADEKSPFI